MALRHPRLAHNLRLQNAAQDSPPLRKGETGEAVAILQQALNDLGFQIPTRTGRPDGTFGDDTIASLHHFHIIYGVTDQNLGGRSSLVAIDLALLEPGHAGSHQTAAQGPHFRAQTTSAGAHLVAGTADANLGGRTSVGTGFPIFHKPGSPGLHHPAPASSHHHPPAGLQVASREAHLVAGAADGNLGGRTSVGTGFPIFHKPGSPGLHHPAPAGSNHRPHEASNAILRQSHIATVLTDEIIGGRTSRDGLMSGILKPGSTGSHHPSPLGPHHSVPAVSHAVVRQTHIATVVPNENLGGRTSVGGINFGVLKPGPSGTYHIIVPVGSHAPQSGHRILR